LKQIANVFAMRNIKAFNMAIQKYTNSVGLQSIQLQLTVYYKNLKKTMNNKRLFSTHGSQNSIATVTFVKKTSFDPMHLSSKFFHRLIVA